MAPEKNGRPAPHAGHRQRIKERYLEKGFAALDDKDILELLLTYAIPRKDVYAVSRELVHTFGTAENVLAAPPEALREAGGLTDHTVVLLKLVNDIRTQPDRFIEYRREQLNNVLAAVEYCHRILGRFPEEAVIMLFLDKENYVIDVTKVSYGSADSAVLPIYGIVETACRHGIERVIVAHNHPSGSSNPSAADLMATDALRSKLLSHGIELAEHIIVAREECTALLHHQTLSLPGGEVFAPWKNDPNA
ncbi:MAG: RadC family protein [Clostridia bacterium]|nr:RadC family protein [Clostridia bacterium]